MPFVHLNVHTIIVDMELDTKTQYPLKVKRKWETEKMLFFLARPQ